ncbi:MAG TPA: ABC transporter permease [Shinella sp.]|jgi:ribose transport system permease protein|uniref:ABC transporter permease n=1 Tax=Shinella sp. TaxID=1870904 RepID=UPI002E13749A|nr:ABC transporter permease [Shinella sp.]
MRAARSFQKLGSLAVPVTLAVVLLAIAVVRAPNLFTPSGIGNGILVAAPLFFATMALTPIVMSGRGAVDLSIGPLIGFLNVTLITWLSARGLTNPVLFIGWALLAGALWQVMLAAIVIYVRIAPIIVSLSGYLVLSGVNLMIMSRPGGVAPDWLMNWGAASAAQIVSPILVLVLVASAFWATITRTGFHRQLRMVGSDERMAYTSGINVDLVRLIAFAIGGMFAGLAALSYTALIASGDPTQGSTYTLQAVTALVLGGASLSGGRGGVVGAALGALNMFLINYLLGTFNFGSLSGYVTQLAFGAILACSLLVNLFTSPFAKRA